MKRRGKPTKEEKENRKGIIRKVVNGDAEPSRDYDAQFPTDNMNMGGNMMGCLVIQSR